MSQKTTRRSKTTGRQRTSSVKRPDRSRDFVVDHAADGRDGLFHATDGSYDAIVLDRMLPGMDGMAVLAALRAAKIATPVIILSSLAAVDARVEGLTSGANDYLVKALRLFGTCSRALNLLIAKPSGGSAPSKRC
jgi:two-component system OmpR family response regulator